jgi:ATP-dependent Clp protease ATP-binding subunit ClpA
VFERFTRAARDAVSAAQAEARSLGHHYIGTEHLLLGILVEEDDAGGRILRRMGVRREAVRRGIVEIVGSGPLVRPDSDALRAIGIDLDEVRRRVEDAFGQGALERTRAAQERSGPGGRGLRAPGLRPPRLRRRHGRRCTDHIGPTMPRAGEPHIPFTPRCKKVLKLALSESRSLGHHHFGTEHILLGLLREGEGVGAALLARAGVRYEDVRARVLGDGGSEPA